MSITNKNFYVNRQHLIDALMSLKENSDDYANINISLSNAATYPDDGILQKVPFWKRRHHQGPVQEESNTQSILVTPYTSWQTFCKPPLICFCGNQHVPPPCGTDQLQCLAKRSAVGLTVEALKFALQCDDGRIINKVLYPFGVVNAIIVS